MMLVMRDPESFVRVDPTLTMFAFYSGREDPNTTIDGPLSARQRNAIEMAFRWRVDVGPTLKAGLVALYFFRGLGQYC